MKNLSSIFLCIALTTPITGWAMHNNETTSYEFQKELFEDLPESNPATIQPKPGIHRTTYIHFQSTHDGHLHAINVSTKEKALSAQEQLPAPTTESIPTQPGTPTQPIANPQSALSMIQHLMAQTYGNNNNNNNAQEQPIDSITRPVKKTRSTKESEPTLPASPITLPAEGYFITGPGAYACLFCQKQFNQHNLQDHNCSVAK